MNDARHGFLQGLSAHLFALEAARPVLARGDASAVPSIQRVARSLADTARQAGYPEVVRAAITAAENAAQPEGLEALLRSVREIANGSAGEKIHLLIIEDDPVAGRFIDASLDSPNRALHACRTLAEADRILDRQDISLVILDLGLPDGDGRGWLVRLRQRAHYAGLPVIVVSGSTGTQPRTECFALGADDFIGKPFDPRSLAACVAVRLQRAADVHRNSLVDPLTNLPNRASLTRAFERCRETARGAGQGLCVGVIRVERLRWTNEAFGNAAGDAVLCGVAARLTALPRNGHVVGRWGGEEFVVVMPNTAESAAARWIEQALVELRALAIKTADGRTFRASFSAGLAEAPPETGGDRAGAGPLLAWLVRMAEQHTRAVDARDAQRARRVLLAEDDEAMVKLVGGLLRLDGFDVAVAADGREALELAPRETPGLVMLDVGLPNVDGFEVLRELRRMPGYDRLPIVMLSGARESRAVARGLELGADDYVVKPFSPVELRSRVRRLVARR